MINRIRSLANRINNGIRGIRIWLKTGYLFTIFFLVILIASLLKTQNWLHIWVILTLGSVLIVTEMLNYAIEKLCNLTAGTYYNPEVKLIKDLCAGAVLTSGAVLGLAGLWIITT